MNLIINVKSFQVASAFELTEAEEKAIVDDLTSKHKTTVTIDTVVDETLKGGVIIKEIWNSTLLETNKRFKTHAILTRLNQPTI